MTEWDRIYVPFNNALGVNTNPSASIFIPSSILMSITNPYSAIWSDNCSVTRYVGFSKAIDMQDNVVTYEHLKILECETKLEH